MGIRYFSQDVAGNTVITQIVNENPTADEIESIIGSSVYKEITTEEMDKIDPEFLGSCDTDYSNLSDNKLTVNLDKAKEVKKTHLRLDRKPLLEAQDILFMQAQESGADTTAIVAEKERLRDITKDADSCTTTNQLKALSVEE
jgi:hypothetical protein